ncbi:iron (metal) dependent repressor, DtxR family [Sporobacter termitidis DSM 10068]|uniref:Iron (Metal) dependent repressor, DtxR family n=1 Tax=Sporobacter termitidis DSM 10068 TaxID=1123282 RepID=A0A1M5XV07_9FIRM|nr:metal-dependent transcriptional regulator [Sporobacter termitidis]SHI03093.1 iron (metal) dependent repressor, DtxR family [Sporobacter termitidis DSM 10068]
MEKLSAAMENYLKTIYNLSRHNPATRVSDIAAHMKLSKASVCRATDLLADKGLVSKSKLDGISLTDEGLEQAALISNKYDIIQMFLNEVLNIDPAVAERDACSFEHSISLESLQSMHSYLQKSKENK